MNQQMWIRTKKEGGATSPIMRVPAGTAKDLENEGWTVTYYESLEDAQMDEYLEETEE